MTTFYRFSFLLIGLLSALSVRAQQPAMRQLGPDMQILGCTEHTLIHRSFLYLDDGQRVACNGLIYVRDSFCLVFDTPVDTVATKYLLDYLEGKLNLQVLGVVVNHAHVDALGGLAEFHRRGITSYAHKETVAACRARGLSVPKEAFARKKKLKIGDAKVYNYYPGAAHMVGNIVSYVPEDQVLYGGCMIKSYGAGKGNLADADVDNWPKAVARVQRKFKEVRQIVPGHGFPGGQELLEYTIELFSEK
ncbi:MAG: subclass B1 metallo-beta-lactamase [Bacteroidetes bacterium]|nr:MAG: subclass B1 metallo-beta-lactamase [Bacteroidota bacterium]